MSLEIFQANPVEKTVRKSFACWKSNGVPSSKLSSDSNRYLAPFCSRASLWFYGLTTRGCDTPVYPRVKITGAWNVRWIRAGARVGFTCVACDSAPRHPRPFAFFPLVRQPFRSAVNYYVFSLTRLQLTQTIGQPCGIHVLLFTY